MFGRANSAKIERMANPLVQKTIPSLSDDRRKLIGRTHLAARAKALAGFYIRSLSPGQALRGWPCADITEQWVERHKRFIAMFESILAAPGAETLKR